MKRITGLRYTLSCGSRSLHADTTVLRGDGRRRPLKRKRLVPCLHLRHNVYSSPYPQQDIADRRDGHLSRVMKVLVVAQPSMRYVRATTARRGRIAPPHPSRIDGISGVGEHLGTLSRSKEEET
jgi:hypothetical protein